MVWARAGVARRRGQRDRGTKGQRGWRRWWRVMEWLRVESERWINGLRREKWGRYRVTRGRKAERAVEESLKRGQGLRNGESWLRKRSELSEKTARDE
jgi:hypothetical protein